MTSDLPPGCHIIPEPDITPEEQQRILLRMLRRARGRCRVCRRDIIELLRGVGEERAEEAVGGRDGGGGDHMKILRETVTKTLTVVQRIALTPDEVRDIIEGYMLAKVPEARWAELVTEPHAETVVEVTKTLIEAPEEVSDHA